MIIKTRLSGNVKKYFSVSYGVRELGRPFQVVRTKSRTELFALIGSGGSYFEVPSNVYWPGQGNFVPDLNKKVEIRLIADFAFETYFDFEGVRYYNDFNITGDNVYLKIGSPFQIAESIRECFEKTGVLDDWDFSWISFNEVSQIDSSTKTLLSITLVRKTPGDYTISSRMKKIEDVKRNIYINEESTILQTPQAPNYTGHHINNFWNPNIYFDYLSPNFKSMIIENYSMSSNAFDNYDYYELGCRIKGGDQPVLLSKKLVSQADFNLTSILKNYKTSNGESLEPKLGSFLFEPVNLIRTFDVDFYQAYIDSTIANNNYINRIYDVPLEIVPGTIYEESPIVIKMIGDSWNRFYEKHIPNKFLDTNYNFTDDYYGILDSTRYPFPYSEGVPFQILTNQPDFKKLNRSWEVLYLLDEKYNNSKLEINITYDDDTQIVSTHSIVHLGEDESNLLVFKTNQWDTSTQSVSRLEVNYLYGIQNPATSSTDIGYITYSQIYYRDPVSTSCDGLDEEDYTIIMFKNSFGVFDIFEFEETSEFNLDRKIEIFQKTPTWMDSKKSKFDSIFTMDITKTYKTSSRILDDEEWIWLEELVKSDDVWVVVAGETYPIIITDINYSSQKNVDKKITMTWKFSRPE